MTVNRDEQPSELTVAPVRGGPPVRLVALGVIGVLAAVVYVGLSGRATTPSALTRPTSAVAAVEPSQRATPTPGVPTTADGAGPYPGATPIDQLGGIRNPSSTLGVALTVAGRLSLGQLDEVAPRHLRATYRLPLPVPATEATLELLNVAYWPPPDYRYATWTVPLAVFDSKSANGAVILNDTQPPQPNARSSAPQLVHNGFRMEVSGARDAQGGLVSIDLTIGMDPTYPDETYDVVAFADGTALPGQIDDRARTGISGHIDLKSKLAGKTIEVILSAAQPNDGFPGPVAVKTFTFSIPRNSHAATADKRFEDTQGPDPRAAGLVGIIANGFKWQSHFSWHTDKPVLNYVLSVNPEYDPALFPAATAVTR